MNESIFFYCGLAAFSMTIIGLGLTVLEFRKFGKADKAEIEIAEPVMREPGIDFANDDSSALKVVKAE